MDIKQRLRDWIRQTRPLTKATDWPPPTNIPPQYAHSLCADALSEIERLEKESAETNELYIAEGVKRRAAEARARVAYEAGVMNIHDATDGGC